MSAPTVSTKASLVQVMDREAAVKLQATKLLLTADAALTAAASAFLVALASCLRFIYR